MGMAKLVAGMDNHVKALEESEALYLPDPHAGNILVDPVTIVCLSYYWELLKKELPHAKGRRRSER